METFTIITTIICFIAYTVFSVWAVKKFIRLSTSIAGSVCLIAGSFGLYFVTPLIAALLLLILKIILILGAIAIVLKIIGG